MGMGRKEDRSLNLIFLVILAFFFCQQGLESLFVQGRSTIGVGEELNSSVPLVSQDGYFTLGFFTIGETNLTYLGIWYTKEQDPRKIWVANQNMPITNNSAVQVLTIDTNGAVKITSGGTTIMTIFDQGGTDNLIATLQDSGNFVLTGEFQNRVLWESFDHPSSALIPGMKLGFNSRTGRNWSLNSWLSYSIAASGAFNLSWENSEESGQLVIYRRGEIYWKSGLLRNQSFEFMPMLNGPSSEHHYNLSYVSNNDEKYFTFNATKEILPLWFLDPRGIILEGNNMHLGPEFCYGYDSKNGCVGTSEVPHCRSDKDTFQQKAAYFIGSSTTYDDQNSSLSISDCMKRCWNDCGGCAGFTSYHSNGTGCFFWNGEYQIDGTPGIPTRYVLVSRKSSKK